MSRHAPGTRAPGPGVPSRLVLAVSLLSGVAQIALLREISASHLLSTFGLALRLILAAVLAATGVGAALAAWYPSIANPRGRAALGAALAVYLLAMLLGLLRWLEPAFAVRAVEPGRLVLLGLLVSPAFAGCGWLLASLVARVQAERPRRVPALVAVSLLGTLLGVFVSHHYAQLIGVNSLLLLAAVCAPALLLDRPRLAAALAIGVTALPFEAGLENLRRGRPDFYRPVTSEGVERVFTGWSPHQKVDLYSFRDEILLGCYNGFWQWWAASRTDHRHAFPGYTLLYDPAWVQGRDVLVIGAGAGMGLLHLEKSEPASVTAVELDPLVVKLMRNGFSRYNDEVYSRVPLHAAEGRAFLDAERGRYDLIVYEGSFLTTSHPRVAVSAENYLYTQEGVARALERLRPRGLGLVLFAGPERALARVAAALRAAGAHVARLHLSYPGTLWRELPVLLFGASAETVENVAERLAERGRGGRARRLPGDGASVAPVSDARPFLYAGAPGELRPLVAGISVGLIVFGLGLGAPGRRRARAYYFLVGAGFVLLQYGVLWRFRSFLGDPVTTAYAVVLLLLAGMATGSWALPKLLATGGRRVLALSLACLGVPMATLIALPFELGLSAWTLRLGLTALVALPLGLVLGVFFPLGLRDAPAAAVPAAYLHDALGTVVGFLLFTLLALAWGVPAAGAAGVLAYLGAWLLRPRA